MPYSPSLLVTHHASLKAYKWNWNLCLPNAKGEMLHYKLANILQHPNRYLNKLNLPGNFVAPLRVLTRAFYDFFHEGSPLDIPEK